MRRTETHVIRCEGCGVRMDLEHEEIVETRESNDGALLCMICEKSNDGEDIKKIVEQEEDIETTIYKFNKRDYGY